MADHIGMTDRGLIRPENEDCFGIYRMGEYAELYVVCDGVGGSAGGKEASAMALSVFSDFLTEYLAPLSHSEWEILPIAQIKRLMRAAATEASRRVHKAAEADPALHGMASTLIAALVTDRRAYVLHVGDSRLYTVTPYAMEQVTRDHSYLQYLLDIGRITPVQAKEMKLQNYITQAIGAYCHVDGDFTALDLATYPSPTYLLLCSDGLYSAVKEDRMHRLITATAPLLQEKVSSLIRAAKDAGGEDNITAVLVSL